MSMQDGRLPWHPAFSAALHIEFEDDLEHLYFHDEYQLSRQPMRMDILIIKKEPDIHIQKNIGQIFRTYNIIEYKPPGVSLNINHFYKVYGYACFFQSDAEKNREINPDEITITYICYHHPRKLLKYLTAARNMTIREIESGIYYLEGAFFKMQLLVTSKLTPEKNYWLSYLRNNLKKGKEIQNLVTHYEARRDSPYYQAVTSLILHANEKLWKEEGELLELLRELFADELKESEERGIAAGEKQGINQGIELTKKILQLSQNGASPADIINNYDITEDIVKKVLS